MRGAAGSTWAATGWLVIPSRTTGTGGGVGVVAGVDGWLGLDDPPPQPTRVAHKAKAANRPIRRRPNTAAHDSAFVYPDHWNAQPSARPAPPRRDHTRLWRRRRSAEPGPLRRATPGASPVDGAEAPAQTGLAPVRGDW